MVVKKVSYLLFKPDEEEGKQRAENKDADRGSHQDHEPRVVQRGSCTRTQE